jgi:HEAT repeat protein
MAQHDPPPGLGADQAEPLTRIEPLEALTLRLVHLPDTLGVGAIPELCAVLDHPDPWVRLHAVEGLARIDHADARAGLVAALHDASFGVHWAAGRALAAGGRAGCVAVLQALVHDTPSTALLHGVAYVLHHAGVTPEEGAAVAPVLEALRHPAADLEAPIHAAMALDQLGPDAAIAVERAQPWYLTGRVRRVLRGHPIVREDTMGAALGG